MANLRGLLGKEFGSTLLTTAGEVGSLSRVRDGKQFVFHPYCNLNNCEANYHEYCLLNWCVPCGTTQITFELWGGGGSGAGGCCCQQGIPGGSGAYVRKTITTCGDSGWQGGCRYALFVAPPTCCSACCVGIQGCKTYITGPAISNLCAEGGLPGKTCCYAFWSTEFRCQDRVYFTGAGGYSPTANCSCGFGGDCIIPGRPGFFRIYNTSNNCNAKIGLAYPAKLIDDLGGHIMSKNMGNSCINDYTYCQGTTPYAYNMNCNNTLPGVGSPSSTSCAGGCCYGWRGGGGLIRITYCSCWIGLNQNCAYHFCN